MNTPKARRIYHGMVRSLNMYAACTKGSAGGGVTHSEIHTSTQVHTQRVFGCGGSVVSRRNVLYTCVCGYAPAHTHTRTRAFKAIIIQNYVYSRRQAPCERVVPAPTVPFPWHARRSHMEWSHALAMAGELRTVRTDGKFLAL